MDAVETRGLVKAYGGKRAVDGLQMHVPQGCVYGFVGKNGAGKSTAMKMMAGLVRPTSGELLLFGQDVTRSRSKAPAVGALIESPGLLSNLSATENLMAKARAMGVRDAKSRCADLLDLVGLTVAAKKRTKGFSLGMKQRLGIALALVGDPQLLLLDEPLNGLDPEGTRDMRTCIGRLASERGVTVVISSHVLDQLNRVADRFGVIASGRMVAEFTDAQMQAACGHAVRVRVEPGRTEAALEVLRAALPQAGFVLSIDGAIEASLAGDGGAAAWTDDAPGWGSVAVDGSAGAGFDVAGGFAATDAGFSTADSHGTSRVLAVSRVLHDAGILLTELTVVNRDIEDYFVELMEGGARHV